MTFNLYSMKEQIIWKPTYYSNKSFDLKQNSKKPDVQ